MSDDFYVGYLPTPPRHRRALLATIPALVVLLALVIVGVGVMQRDPGDGVWETGEPRQWEGDLIADPFPRLVTNGGSVFLVEFGKIGSQRRAEPFLGRRVRVSGWLLERDGRRIVELEPGDGAISEVGPAGERAPAEALGEVTLIGEIMDSKCYLGAMKPGDGKAHKACATLCISGGIPPSLVVRNAAGAATHYIVVSESGARADDLILDLVAEPVVISGRLERRGDVRFLFASRATRH